MAPQAAHDLVADDLDAAFLGHADVLLQQVLRPGQSRLRGTPLRLEQHDANFVRVLVEEGLVLVQELHFVVVAVGRGDGVDELVVLGPVCL